HREAPADAPDPGVADDPPAATAPPPEPAHSRAEPSVRPPDETNPTAGAISSPQRHDETKPTPGPAPSLRDDSRTRSGDRTPGPGRRERRPGQKGTAELDRLEAEVEAIERIQPLRALGLSPPR